MRVGIRIGATLDGRAIGRAGDLMRGLRQRTTQAVASTRGWLGSINLEQRRVAALGRAYTDLQQARSRRAERRGELVGATIGAAAMLAPIVGATKAAIDFESVMADVRKVVDFDTPEQFAAMGQDILRLSERIPVAASGLGDIVAAAGQAGIAREELTRFAEDAAKVAVAFDISGAEAGGRLTGLRSIFRLNQDGVMALAGSYNHLSNNMDATAPAMLNIAERAGSVAAEFGLTGQQTGALAATFLALKTPPEVAGTAINAMLVKLSTAPQQSDKFQDALYELGTSAEELKEAIQEDAQGALSDFLQLIDESDDKQAILFALFGQEYVDDITKLAGNLDLYNKALGLSADRTAALTSIEEEYQARAATTANQMQLLKNQTNVLGVNIGNVLLPAVNDAVSVLGNLVSRAASLAREYPGATKAVLGLVGGLAFLRVGAALARYGATFLSEGWAIARIGMLRSARGAIWLGRGLNVLAFGAIPATVRGARRLRFSLSALTPFWGAGGPARLGRGLRGLATRAIPTTIGALRLLKLALIGTGIGAIVVLLGTGAALIIGHWERVSAFFSGFGSGLLRELGPVGEWLGRVFSWIGDVFTSIMSPMEASQEELESWSSAGERVGALIGKVFRGLAAPIMWVIEKLGALLEFMGLLSGEEIEAKITALQEGDDGSSPARRPPPPPPPSPVRQTIAAVALGAAAATAPAPAAGEPPAFPTLETPAPGSSFPSAPGSGPDAERISAKIREDLAAAGFAEPEEDPAVARRIEAGLADLKAGGETEEVPLGGEQTGYRAAQPGAPHAATLVFHQTFYFDGSGEGLDQEIARRMEIVMRRASVEAGLVEAEESF